MAENRAGELSKSYSDMLAEVTSLAAIMADTVKSMQLCKSAILVAAELDALPPVCLATVRHELRRQLERRLAAYDAELRSQIETTSDADSFAFYVGFGSALGVDVTEARRIALSNTDAFNPTELLQRAISAIEKGITK